MFEIENGRKHFFQWDTGQRLIISDATVVEAHFCNRTDDCSLTCEVYTDGGKRVVDVPNILLQDNWDIRVYAYCKSYTKVEERFEVVKRSKPADYVYTETEVKSWEALNDRANAALEDVEEVAAAEAERQEAEAARQEAAAEMERATADAITAANAANDAVNTLLSNAHADAIVPEITATVVSVDDAAATLAIGAITHIAAPQAGEGVASPTNIRAISGRDTATLIRTGTNIIDTKHCGYCYNWMNSNPIILERTETGFKMTTNSARENSWIRMMAYIGTREELAGQTLTLSADYTSSATHANNRANKAIALLDKLDGYISGAVGGKTIAQGQGADSITGTIPNEGSPYVFAVFYLGYGYTAPAGSVVEWSNIRVNVGDTDKGYEPYVATTLTADLPETIYGGTIDWNTGILTITHATYTVTGEEAWTQSSSPTNRYNAVVKGVPKSDAVGQELCPDVLCSHNKTAAKANSNGVWVINGNAENEIGLRWVDGDRTFGDNLTTYTDYLKAQYAANTPAVFVYRMDEKYHKTYQLTPQQLELFKGNNNVYSNCGETTLTYIADTKLYIDGKFAALQNAIVSLGSNI